jgi:hypothetical protein
MTITTEEAGQMAEICGQLGGFAQCAAALRSLAAERDALKAENEKLQDALRAVMCWINEWEPAFLQDEEWYETNMLVQDTLGEKK